jgi:cobalt-zinc-cadmium efflux system protein
MWQYRFNLIGLFDIKFVSCFG